MQKTQTDNFATQPLTVASAADIQWHDEADVLVVGYGGAGVCAALAATEGGAKVIAIDRFGGGGATAVCGGIVYGGATPYQKAAGIEDTADEMYKYLKHEVGDVVRNETLRRFCNDSSENFAWLNSHGVHFASNVFEGKRSYPPTGYDIYYSGNEASPLSTPVAKAAPRGHRVVGQGYTGKDFYQALDQSAQSKGVRLFNHSAVSRLVVDGNAQVIGVEIMQLPENSKALKTHKKLIKKINDFQRFFEKKALSTGAKIEEIEKSAAQSRFIRARKGVVLTTGSFTFNRQMVKHYAPKYAEAMPLGTTGCNGDGIRLGLGLGSKLGYMDSVTAWRTISPPVSFVKSIVVNKSGQRFIAEDMYLGHLGYRIAEQAEQRAWLIIDSHTYWHAFKGTLPKFGEESYLEFRGPLLINLLFNNKRAKTLEALAKKIGVDAKGLCNAVANYNLGVNDGVDAFQKKLSNLRTIGAGSYYAIDISTGSKKFPCTTIPMGGVVVDENTGQVLRENNSPIAGLYAAGRGAVGIPSGFYVSGMSLADCVFSGRRAGTAVAKTNA